MQSSSSNRNHLLKNFQPGRISIIPNRIDENDESCLDASTVPTYEEFTSKNKLSDKITSTQRYLNSTAFPDTTCILTDDEDENSFEGDRQSQLFKNPAQRIPTQKFDASVIEISSITDSMNTINLNNVQKKNNNLFNNISNKQNNIISPKPINNNVTKLVRKDDDLKLGEENKKIPIKRAKISSWDSIPEQLTPSSKTSKTPLKNKLIPPSKIQETTPSRYAKIPSWDSIIGTPRNNLENTPKNVESSKHGQLLSSAKKNQQQTPKKDKDISPILQLTTPVRISKSKIEIIVSIKTPAKSSLKTPYLVHKVLDTPPEVLVNQFNESAEYVEVLGKCTQTNFNECFESPNVSKKSPIKWDSPVILDETIETADKNTSAYHSQNENEVSKKILDSPEILEEVIETAVKHTSVYQSQYEVTKEIPDSPEIFKEVIETNDKHTSVYNSQNDVLTEISRNFRLQISSSSSSSSSNDESDSNQAVQTPNITFRKSQKKSVNNRHLANESKPDSPIKKIINKKKRVSMCGEGLTKAQLKIDQTILDESENESDIKNGKIFTLHASLIEEDLNSSGSNSDKDQSKKFLKPQVINDNKNTSSNKNDSRSNILMISSSPSSDEKNKLKSNKKKPNMTSEDSSEDKFEEFLKELKSAGQNKFKDSPKFVKQMNNFVVNDSQAESNETSSSNSSLKKSDTKNNKSKKILVEDSLSDSLSDSEQSKSYTTSDTDDQLFIIRTTNKLTNTKKQDEKLKPTFKPLKSTLLDDSSSSESSSNEESIISITNSDSDSTDDELNNKYKDINSKFKKPIGGNAWNTFKTPVSNKNKIGEDSRLIKTQKVPQKEKVKESKLSFIESLSVLVENEQLRDPNVLNFMKKFKNKIIKQELMQECFNKINEKAFDNQLPKDLKLSWSSRLTSTGGFCKNNLKFNTAEIQLSTKVCDTPERMRDVLAHEMCHAATFLLNGVLDGHGPLWKSWANRVNFSFKKIPKITVTHSYEIKKKFIFKCLKCGYEIHRFSKSIDINKQGCGICHGRFEMILNKPTNTKAIADQTKKTKNNMFDRLVNNAENESIAEVAPATPARALNAFSKYVKENYGSVKKDRGLNSHGEVMKELGAQFKEMKTK